MLAPPTFTRVLTSSLRLSRLPAARPANFISNRRNFTRSAVNMVAGLGDKTGTVSEEVMKDHRELEEYYNNILNAQDDDTRARWQNQFTWELSRHSIAEELIVYPAFEKHLGPSGKEMAYKDRAEHQVLKNELKRFQNMKPNDPELIPLLKQMFKDLQQHIKEEENDDLPKLEQALSTDDSIAMAKSFDRTKAFVPSRSHPSAPTKPVFETVVGLMTAPIDHISDMFRKFPDKTVSPNPTFK